MAEAFEHETVGDFAEHDGADDVGCEVGQRQPVVEESGLYSLSAH